MASFLIQVNGCHLLATKGYDGIVGMWLWHSFSYCFFVFNVPPQHVDIVPKFNGFPILFLNRGHCVVCCIVGVGILVSSVVSRIICLFFFARIRQHMFQVLLL